ncbi:EAL domain-containing protein [Paraglaciecola aestuariivivens]
MQEKILVVDDEPTILRLVQFVLEEHGYMVITTQSGEEALQLAVSAKPDLIILDVNMPGGWSGFETCQKFKAHPEFSSIPIIFLTANAKNFEEGFKLGCADYLAKPINQSELVVRTQFHLKMRRLVNEAQSANEHLEEQVFARTRDLTESNRRLNQVINERKLLEERLQDQVGTDFLTQLASGVAFEKELQACLDNRVNSQTKGAFLFLDLFEFESINQLYGWEAGDYVLITISQMLPKQLTPSTLVGRLGGDQFAVFLPDTDKKTTKNIARGLIDCVSTFPFKWQDNPMQVNLCIGYCFVEHKEKDVRKIISRASQASAIAKSHGAGTIINYHEQTAIQSPKEADEEFYRYIESALQANQFSVFFQKVFPIKNLFNYKPSIELLIRLKSQSSERLMLPTEFLTFAKRSTLSHKIDLWMVKQAINWLAKQTKIEKDISHVSINLSAQSIANPMFLITLENLLSEKEVPAKLVCFELSEPDVLHSISRTRTFLARLKAIGCKTCIDDFGGQSSIYQYLTDLPIDQVKVGGSFIQQLANSPLNSVVLKMFKNLTEITGNTLVAKQVENEQVAEKLKHIGVGFAQGQHFHAPCALKNYAPKKQT